MPDGHQGKKVCEPSQGGSSQIPSQPSGVGGLVPETLVPYLISENSKLMGASWTRSWAMSWRGSQGSQSALIVMEVVVALGRCSLGAVASCDPTSLSFVVPTELGVCSLPGALQGLTWQV
ncbi:hypothetical protein P7K49_014188 [Saguinus oedipus]|uniref:Uncharacterized protein n=1 Tax=Saguinus oedipus TaxID=9490 RepID=A0ABQ9VI27_SAGOE|nr:hypothetical protein P7K49_014188 [Saguinus oedipus]